MKNIALALSVVLLPVLGIFIGFAGLLALIWPDPEGGGAAPFYFVAALTCVVAAGAMFRLLRNREGGDDLDG